jgi:hypothetical protein
MRIVLLSLLFLAGCSRVSVSRGPLPHEVYVWQRQWTPAVRNGIERASASVAGFNVLIGEIDPHGDTVRTSFAHPDYPALAHAGKPIGLGLRIGVYRGEFSPRSKPLRAAIDTLRAAIDQAKAADLAIAELQIDFDCPSSRLAGYAIWARELHSAFPGMPLAITALPDWLARSDFGALAAAAGRFVLQVHSVSNQPGTTPVLCDTGAARKAIARAGKFGIPFRVALPTYSCELLADASGNVVGVRAEGSPPPTDAMTLVLRSDAAEMAAFVRELETERPVSLAGIIWYRLPIDSDRLNWRWPTLAAIIAGRTPRAEGKLVFEASESGVEDAVLENQGDADWAMPAEIALPEETIAADGVNGFQIEPTASGQWKLRRSDERILPPGGRMVCGWIRRSARGIANQPLPNIP